MGPNFSVLPEDFSASRLSASTTARSARSVDASAAHFM
eukprot:CAMPEP_0204511936 /NCGR_PEP_ID=MMETSP0661-20131031/701_1 /ASSEMBLY_ACC=CAM_ASM_000606 /TAXON_ID=109239 /ORGANISM="Alexandrium margalefi, Strain AMGDE01CS-322" /LENGTH=37 /DNA_ID= /DNA_START= /DNA_END= /DNA_ORIENTATION=